MQTGTARKREKIIKSRLRRRPEDDLLSDHHIILMDSGTNNGIDSGEELFQAVDLIKVNGTGFMFSKYNTLTVVVIVEKDLALILAGYFQQF
jgi:hypothetical protein